MNIPLRYLPFAMFSETCDLLMSECKTPPHGNRTEVRTRWLWLHPAAMRRHLLGCDFERPRLFRNTHP